MTYSMVPCCCCNKMKRDTNCREYINGYICKDCKPMYSTPDIEAIFNLLTTVRKEVEEIKTFLKYIEKD